LLINFLFASIAVACEYTSLPCPEIVLVDYLMPKFCIANASVRPARGRCRARLGAWVPWFLGTMACVFAPDVALERPAIAQKVNRATIAQILDGSDVSIQNRPAKVNDSASKGQRIRTGAARAELKFDTGAVGRMGHNSTLTVGQCARLKRGTILINGAMNGCSGSAVAGVRGTTYLMEVDAAGQTRVSVLEGNVTVAPAAPGEAEDADDAAFAFDQDNFEQGKQLKRPWRVRLPRSLPATLWPSVPRSRCARCTPAPRSPGSPGSPVSPSLPVSPGTGRTGGPEGTVQVATGETVVVTTAGKVGTVAKLSETEYRRILTGALFDGYTLQIPGIAKVRGAYQQLFPGFPFPAPNVNLRINPPLRIRSPF
jgi:FecR protein